MVALKSLTFSQIWWSYYSPSPEKKFLFHFLCKRKQPVKCDNTDSLIWGLNWIFWTGLAECMHSTIVQRVESYRGLLHSPAFYPSLGLPDFQTCSESCRNTAHLLHDLTKMAVYGQICSIRRPLATLRTTPASRWTTHWCSVGWGTRPARRCTTTTGSWPQGWESS